MLWPFVSKKSVQFWHFYILLVLMFSAKLQVHRVENSSSKCACMMTSSKSFRIIQWYLVMDRVPWNWGFLQLEIYGENRLKVEQGGISSYFFVQSLTDDFSTLLTLKNTTPKPTVQKWDASLLVNLWLSSGILLPYLVTSSPLHLLQSHNWNNWGWV